MCNENTQWEYQTVMFLKDTSGGVDHKLRMLNSYGVNRWEFDGFLESNEPGVETMLLRRPIIENMAAETEEKDVNPHFLNVGGKIWIGDEEFVITCLDISGDFPQASLQHIDQYNQEN